MANKLFFFFWWDARVLSRRVALFLIGCLLEYSSVPTFMYDYWPHLLRAPDGNLQGDTKKVRQAAGKVPCSSPGGKQNPARKALVTYNPRPTILCSFRSSKFWANETMNFVGSRDFIEQRHFII